MKLSCEIVQDLLPLYCDGVCSEESRQAVADHLEGCEKCRADVRLMERDMKAGSAQPQEKNAAQAAAAAWKKGRTRAFIIGCLIALLSVAVLAAGYCSFHWFSTADESDLDAMARQAASYLGRHTANFPDLNFNYDELSIEKIEQRGNYLAALCKDADGNWCMCEFDRDRLFENRWRANGGKVSLKDGAASSWNYGSPKGEAVLIFCGGNIPDEVCWYKFQNNNITYICPVENNTILDIFIIQDSSSIGGYPILLDRNQQEIE